MCAPPQGLCQGQGIETFVRPPCEFIAKAMDITVVRSAHGHCELVADLPTEGTQLGEAQVMGV